MTLATIVLCAGSGRRLNSDKSKIIHDICGRPLGYWAIKNAIALSSEKPIVVISHQAEYVKESLARYFPHQLSFAYQDKPLGTADAVKAALPHLTTTCQTVLVLSGDSPLLREESLKELVALWQKDKPLIALFTAQAQNPKGYGRILRNQAGELLAIVEEKDATPAERALKEVNSGIYAFDAQFLRHGLLKLANNNALREFYLTDLLALAVQEKGRVASLDLAFEDMQGVNNRLELSLAEQVMQKRIIEHWMLLGVSFKNPAHSYVEASVELSPDVTIFPGVSLRGSTKIASGVIIENGSIIKDSHIEKNAHILPYCCLDQALVGESCQIGPFARLRPKTQLDAQVKIGNFVEIKASHIKSKTKAGHLAYIGDAEIGENCNVGAGTIICNYDGIKKNNTVISDHVFIGSNNTIISPLSIGEGAYLAGGSTINQDVPKGALAIGRARQLNKESYKHKNK